MAFNIEDLITPIINAMQPVLATQWGDVKEYAETEAAKMAHTLSNIADLFAANKIDQAQASALLDMQKQASQAVLLAIEGIGLIAAQNAINAALSAVATVVNRTLGFSLL